MAACGFAEEALFTGWICAILAFSLVLISSGIGWFYVCYLFGLVSCGGSSALRRPEGNNMVHQRVQGDTVILWVASLWQRRRVVYDSGRTWGPFLPLCLSPVTASRFALGLFFLPSLSFECLVLEFILKFSCLREFSDGFWGGHPSIFQRLSVVGSLSLRLSCGRLFSKTYFGSQLPNPKVLVIWLFMWLWFKLLFLQVSFHLVCEAVSIQSHVLV